MRVFKDLGIPGPEPNFLLGNLVAFKDKMICERYQEWRDLYGDTFGSVLQPGLCMCSRLCWLFIHLFICFCTEQGGRGWGGVGGGERVFASLYDGLL